MTIGGTPPIRHPRMATRFFRVGRHCRIDSMDLLHGPRAAHVTFLDSAMPARILKVAAKPSGAGSKGVASNPLRPFRRPSGSLLLHLAKSCGNRHRPSVNSSVTQLRSDTVRSGRDSLIRSGKRPFYPRKQSRNRSIPTLASNDLRRFLRFYTSVENRPSPISNEKLRHEGSIPFTRSTDNQELANQRSKSAVNYLTQVDSLEPKCWR